MKDSHPVILAIFAHPDDDELNCFGTLAKLQQEGCHVYVLELTVGEHMPRSNKHVEVRSI